MKTTAQLKRASSSTHLSGQPSSRSRAPAIASEPSNTLDVPTQLNRAAQLGHRFEQAEFTPESLQPTTSGQPLPQPLREKMESAFSTDFSNVRVHEDGKAAKIGALAYTKGTHLHFAPGQFRPHSVDGQKIIGHELTHVMQQRAGQVDAAQDNQIPINKEPELESEADRLGEQSAFGQIASLNSAKYHGASVQQDAQVNIGAAIQCVRFKSLTSGLKNFANSARFWRNRNNNQQGTNNPIQIIPPQADTPRSPAEPRATANDSDPVADYAQAYHKARLYHGAPPAYRSNIEEQGLLTKYGGTGQNHAANRNHRVFLGWDVGTSEGYGQGEGMSRVFLPPERTRVNMSTDRINRQNRDPTPENPYGKDGTTIPPERRGELFRDPESNSAFFTERNIPREDISFSNNADLVNQTNGEHILKTIGQHMTTPETDTETLKSLHNRAVRARAISNVAGDRRDVEGGSKHRRTSLELPQTEQVDHGQKQLLWYEHEDAKL